MKVLIVYAHPNPESFNGAILKAFTSGLEEAGHTFETVDLYATGFDPRLSSEEIVAQFTGGQLPQDVVEQQEKVAQADILAFIYPVWWWRGPAILEGWADRVLTPGCAYQFTEQGMEGLMGDKKAILINSAMGSEEYYTSSGIGDAMRKVAQTVFTDGCGIQDIEHIFLYAVHDIDDETRKGYLESVHDLGKGL